MLRTDRSVIKTIVGGLLLFPLMMKLFPVLLEPFFWINNTLVRSIGSVAVSSASDMFFSDPLKTPFVSILIGSGTSLNSIGVVIASLLLLFLAAILNFQYFVRRFMLAVLLIMFPVVAFLQIFPSNRNVLRMWISEFFANLFLQSAHAITYVLFLMYVFGAKLPFIPIVAMLSTLASITVFIRSLMGCQGQSGLAGAAGGIMGVSALMGATRIAGNVLSGAKDTKRSYSTAHPDEGAAPALAAGMAATATADSSAPAGVGQPDPAAAAGFGLSADGPDQIPVGGELDAGVPSSSSTQTGPVWGMKPRVEPIRLGTMAGKAATIGTVSGMMFGGAMVGGAALGPAGVGLGTYIGTSISGELVKAGAHGLGIAENYSARNKVISDIMTKNKDARETYLSENPNATYDEMDAAVPAMTREDAAVFAATGVMATRDEIMYDEEMSNQYSNFMNVTGLPTMQPGSISGKHLVTRSRAKDARNNIIRENPDMPMQDVNNRILNEIIRPVIAQPAFTPAPTIPKPESRLQFGAPVQDYAVESGYTGLSDYGGLNPSYVQEYGWIDAPGPNDLPGRQSSESLPPDKPTLQPMFGVYMPGYSLEEGPSVDTGQERRGQEYVDYINEYGYDDVLPELPPMPSSGFGVYVQDYSLEGGLEENINEYEDY